MISDIQARVASIEARFKPRPARAIPATPTTAHRGSGAASSFQQILNQQQLFNPNAVGPTGATTVPGSLGQMWDRAAGLTPAAPAWQPVRPMNVGALPSRAAQFQPAFQDAGARYGVDPDLLAAVAWTESGFDPGAVSHAGAIGLMQIMPGTAAGLGVDPRDPLQAIDGAARYLRDQFDQFGDVRLALAAYNAGPGAVQRHGGIPPYAETTSYVQKVMARYDSLRTAS